MTVVVERKYALVRVESGDYLLLGNDGRTLWRIYRYIEDGSLWQHQEGDRYGEPSKQIKGSFWANARYQRTVADRFRDYDDPEFLDWDRWTTWETLMQTRQEAIDSALTAGG